MKRFIIFCFLLLVFLLSSCGYFGKRALSLRKDIIKNNPGVTAVGIIQDWTFSDDKYLGIELILEGDKRLFFTTANSRKFPNASPPRLGKVGNYAFATVYHRVHKQTSETKILLETNIVFIPPDLSVKTGVSINTMGDLVKYYDDINRYVESLPTVNEENYQRCFEEGMLFGGTVEENENYYFTGYTVKTVWDDKYYGTRMGQTRMPDYDGDEFVTVPYFEVIPF